LARGEGVARAESESRVLGEGQLVPSPLAKGSRGALWGPGEASAAVGFGVVCPKIVSGNKCCIP